MTGQNYSFRDILAASKRVDWRVEDVIGGAQKLDFGRPFLPEALAQTSPLGFLSPAERRLLNQIRGHAYLGIFALAEEFILPFVLDHARCSLDADRYRMRALLQFAGEEAKHLQLFQRFRTDFECGFGQACRVIGPAAEVGRTVLAHHPLGVALTVLHIEWMTQRHYVDSVRDDQALDPAFRRLLEHHWMEEAQHARLDALLVLDLAEGLDAVARDKAVQDYLSICSLIDRLLRQQVEFDLDALQRAIGRVLGEREQAAFRAVQQRANRGTYLGAGMTHKHVAGTLAKVHPAGAAQVAAVAKLYR